MTVIRANVELAKRNHLAREGNSYVFGGNWSEADTSVGTDCSGEVVDDLDACVNGPAMSWSRHGMSTASWRALDYGQAEPTFGTICVRSPADIPADAAVKIALHHGPGDGANSHMWCEIDGLRCETNGTNGTVTGQQALPIDSSYANDWAYLPGPIVENDATPHPPAAVVLRGLDYAGGRPSGAAIAAAGYQFVCRYLSDGGPALPGKLLLPGEAQDLRANNIQIVTVWETTEARALAGHDAGVADAQAALAQVLACGGSADRPIYFAVDFDATSDQQASINAYLFGAGTILPGRVGVYGGFWVVSRALDSGCATWAWQTEAWSQHNVEPRCNIVQRNNLGYVTVDGVQCDIDETRTTDFGQWDHQPSAPPPPQPAPQPQPTVGDISMADAQAILNKLDGPDGPADGGIPPWRPVRLYRHVTDSQDRAVARTNGAAAEEWNTPSTLDEVTVLAEDLTVVYVDPAGQKWTLADMVIELFKAHKGTPTK